MKTLKVNKEWFNPSSEKNSQAFLLSISSSVITENIIPWLTSFNNISFKESKTEEYVKTWFLDFGAKDILIGIEAKTYQSSNNSLDVMIYLYRKNFEKISSFYNYFYLFRYSDLTTTSTTEGIYFRLSKNFFTITKENNLIALFQGGSYDLPDGKDYIVFDEDNFGEKYIMLRGSGFGIVENKEDSAILYFNNEIPIFYAGKTDIQKYSKENYLIAKKMKINYYPALNNFYALSTNILKIDNINLETDKNTAHKIIEVNGIKYRKIIYNFWIEDNED